MSRRLLKDYQSAARLRMESVVISSVSAKIPGWFNRIYGFGMGYFFAQDKDGKCWRISFDGDCYCEETNESR